MSLSSDNWKRTILHRVFDIDRRYMYNVNKLEIKYVPKYVPICN